MTIRQIRRIGDPVLRQAARPVRDQELGSPWLDRLVEDLVATMRAANGAGLAANQIGEAVRVCVIEVRPGNPRYPYKPPIPLTVLINPVVEAFDDEVFHNYEGCLSVPDLRGVVARKVRVGVSAVDPTGTPIQCEVAGLSAGTFQHEVDHLDGKLFVDRVVGTETLCTWGEFDKHHRAGFEARARALVDRFGS
jgi:peptide deformylase